MESVPGPDSSPFDSGHTYSRQQDLHDHYSGQRQGGISTPADYHLIVLVTSKSGSEYGYKDEFTARQHLLETWT